MGFNFGGNVFNQDGTSTSRDTSVADDISAIGRPQPTRPGFNPARAGLLEQNFQARLRASQTGNPAAISATAITGAGELFSRSVSSAFGVEDPREAQARLTQEAALAAASSEAQPGTPEYTQELTKAFASRGLASEALAALQQGKKLEREQAAIGQARARTQQLEIQSAQLLQSQVEAETGGDVLTREELLKDSSGREAWGRAGFEVARRQQQRIAQGEQPLSKKDAKQLQQQLATLALVRQADQTSTTISSGDTGTTTSRTVRTPINLGSGIAPTSPTQAQAIQSAQSPSSTNPVTQAQVGQTVERLATTPIPGEERVIARSQVSAAKSGAVNVRPTTRPGAGGGPKASRDRIADSRKALRPLSDSIRSLNRLMEVIDRVGPVFDASVKLPFKLGTIPVQDAIEEGVRRFGNPAAAIGISRRARDRKELSGAYNEVLSAMVSAISGAQVTEGEVARFMEQAVDPTSLAARQLGKEGLQQVYTRLYKAILGKAQNVSDEFSVRVKLPEFHRSIRAQLK